MKNEAELLVKYAEREVVRSRGQLMATIAEIRHRIDPRVMAAETADKIVGRASDALSATTSSVKSHPVLSLGGVAAFVGALGLRTWLARRKVDSDAT